MVLIYSEPLGKWKCVFKECKAACCSSKREVTAGDIRRIANSTGLNPEEFADLNDDKGLFRLKSVKNSCFFLREDSSCKIHKLGVKPLFCRMFPFKFDGIIYADEIVLKVKAIKECPGFGKGLNKDEKFEASIEELGNQFVKEIKDFLKEKKLDSKEFL
jgi:Fe-S-cluster containining protein|tara:strand:- start:255 stop:731 length:477 start_codon:yes stop_codon:yes gene_type:complete